MSVAELQSALLASPSLFPLRMNDAMDVVQFVKLDALDYERASFLDERMLQPAMAVGNVPWNFIAPLHHSLPVLCDYIFHVSHCGSTLISRLLGLHPQCFALREPWLLRNAQHLLESDRLPLLLGLWSRAFHPRQRAMIKATSFVNACAQTLMELSPESRALLVFIPAESYLAAVLDGSFSDIEAQLEPRWNRLPHYGIQIFEKSTDLSPGERSAMSWLVEMLALDQLSRHLPSRTMWLDFEQFLKTSAPDYCRVADFFRLPSPAFLEEHHQLLHRYAKKPEVRYDLNVRRQLQAASHHKHRAEINRGISWLNRYGPSTLSQRIRANA